MVPSILLNKLSMGDKCEADAETPLAKIVVRPAYSPPILISSFPPIRLFWIFPAT